ncbi:hypothetical protein TIFTF001_023920 [Ficus carica]|uniref:Uncharacterized protein n=1 Tax=Ficus carica TaxID=3494 RepID=A0AA88AFM8_FICCA|nr:hypothetical protein TIFTF001_023920 [Ficus carica]
MRLMMRPERKKRKPNGTMTAAAIAMAVSNPPPRPRKSREHRRAIHGSRGRENGNPREKKDWKTKSKRNQSEKRRNCVRIFHDGDELCMCGSIRWTTKTMAVKREKMYREIKYGFGAASAQCAGEVK